MKTSNRRRFLRDTSLTATGVAIASPILAKSVQKSSSKFSAPFSVTGVTAALVSVKSGNWSDAATWGGKVPAATDTPTIAAGHTVVYDLATTTVAGVTINSGGKLSFDATKSTLLQSTANIVVEGTLEMRPPTSAIVQTIRFTNINENAFVGSTITVASTDIGLWVTGAGKLDLVGSAKNAWSRATGAIASGATTVTIENSQGWLAGDEISITPTEAPTVAGYATGFDLRTITQVTDTTLTLNTPTSRPHPMVNGLWTAEVLNLTRNVRLEGTSTGRAHLLINSTSVQNIKYVGIRYFGPRKDRSGDGIKELVKGRYGLHFETCGNSSRGTVVEGVVIRDNNSHSFVPHLSHGIKFIDNITYNTLETAFWYEPGEPANDITYDHNVVALCNYVPGSLNMNAEDAPTFSSSGFALNTGDGNICQNNVVIAGGMGDFADGGAYNWEAVINEGVWIHRGNMSHNNACGLRVWQNSTRNHIIEDFIGYHNEMGIFHGAYANSYTYNGGTLYGNQLQIKAASVNSNRVRIENMVIDGANIIDNGVEVIHSPLAGDRPIIMINCNIRNCKKAAIYDSVAPEIHSIDVINCTLQGALILAPEAVVGETIRVQPLSGQAYKIDNNGQSNIAPFAASLWGTGKGLLAEYFNSANFTNPAFSRIDSNISFSEWSTGVHYAITGQVYSVRWTGYIQAQYSETYQFSFSSGGGHRIWINNVKILDSWIEHYPDSFPCTPIALVAGQKYPITVEYFNTEGGTGAGLIWKCPSMPIAEYVPQSQLYTDAVITPNPINQAPVANAGNDITIALPISSTTLNGSGSVDTDGTIASYSWTKISGPASFTIANATSASTALTGLVQGTYVFRIKVTDNKGATNEDDVTVTVLAAPASNIPPVANAGADITITLPTSSTTLVGTASSDADGSIASYLWTKVSGPTSFTIASPNAATSAITGLVQGTYVFRLRVTDNAGAYSEDDVTVTVKAAVATNQPPVANAGSDIIITLPTNSANLNGSLSNDPDGGSLTYLWTKVSGPTSFTIASPSAATTAITGLVQGTYVFRLKVTDNANASTTDDVTVTVNAQIPGNNGPVANAGSDATITLPVNTISLSGVNSTDSDGTITGFKWEKVSGPASANIASPSSVSTSVTALVEGTYTFKLTVTDNKGATASDEVTVVVKAATPVDQLPPLTVIVMPNPSTRQFTLKISSGLNFPVSVRVFDMNGKQVERILNLSASSTAVIGRNLPKGTYVASIEQGLRKVVKTLIKL